MAKRPDSGSHAPDGPQRPNPHDEDGLPEFTDNVRGRGDDEAERDDFDDEDMEQEEGDEGSY